MDDNAIKNCLSIREPYVSLITAKQKTLEYRTRKLIARPPQTIAIATSKAGAGDFLPGGRIVGVARISAVVPWRDESNTFWQRAQMDKADGYMCGGYAMMISGYASCKPVEVRGNVGLYRVPDGFTPQYATSAEELQEWWSAARVWSQGAADDDERQLMECMLYYGAGWRIDD
jgi:hypothetical protein